MPYFSGLSPVLRKPPLSTTDGKAISKWGTMNCRPRGGLGKRVLAALEGAGPAGVKVAELAKTLGVKGTNLHVWFATTGKKHAKKVGRGHYRVKK